MRYLFIVSIGIILSACSECRYGTPYIRECTTRWGGTQWSEEQRYVLGNQMTKSRARQEILDCKRKGYNSGHSSYEQGYQAGDVWASTEYCMAKKGYLSNTEKEPLKLSKNEILKKKIEWYENLFIEKGKEHLIIKN